MGALAPLEGQIMLGSKDKNCLAYLPQQSEIEQYFPISVVDLVAMGLWHEIGLWTTW